MRTICCAGLVALVAAASIALAQCPGGICPPGYGGYTAPTWSPPSYQGSFRYNGNGNGWSRPYAPPSWSPPSGYAPAVSNYRSGFEYEGPGARVTYYDDRPVYYSAPPSYPAPMGYANGNGGCTGGSAYSYSYNGRFRYR